MNEKIGMYTEDEILEHLTEGEGRGFLGRSMYDAIFDKIHALITENEQLKNDNADLKERYNNMFECHCNRVEVEELQNNWNELKKALKEEIDICDGCIDTMTSDLQETTPIGHGKSYLTSEIFKNKVAKRSFEITLDKMQELEQVK